MNLTAQVSQFPLFLVTIALAYAAFKLRQRMHHVEFFACHLAALLKRNLPVVDGLRLLAEDAAMGLRRRLLRVAQAVSEGRPLWTALERERGWFPAAFVAAARAGEETGSLARILPEVARALRAESDTRTHFLAYLAYATFLLSYIATASTGSAIYVLPSFARVLGDLGSDPHSSLLDWADGVLAAAWVFFSLLGIAMIHAELIQPRLARWALFRAPWDFLLHSVPGVGRLLAHSCCARYAGVLAALLESGVPTADALDVAARSEAQTVMRRRFHRAAKTLRTGVSLGESLRRARVTEPLPWCAAAAEGTGRVPAALAEAGRLLEARVHTELGIARRMALPAIVLILGGVVGILCVSTFHMLARITQATLW